VARCTAADGGGAVSTAVGVSQANDELEENVYVASLVARWRSGGGSAAGGGSSADASTSSSVAIALDACCCRAAGTAAAADGGSCADAIRSKTVDVAAAAWPRNAEPPWAPIDFFPPPASASSSTTTATPRAGLLGETTAAADEGPSPACPFDALPDELVEHILGLVDSASVLSSVHAVCTRWRLICRNLPVVVLDTWEWERAGVATSAAVCEWGADELLRWTLDTCRRFRGVRRVDCLHRFELSDAIAVIEHCPNLREVSMQGSRVPHLTSPPSGAEMLASALAGSCPKLQTIELFGAAANDFGMLALALGCPNLVRVSCHNAFGVTDVGVATLTAGCRRLETLQITFDIKDTGVTDVGVEAVARYCPRLSALKLDSTAVTDASLLSLAKHCGALMQVEINSDIDQRLVTDAGVAALARGCPRLRALTVHGSPAVSDGGLASLAAHCPDLTAVRLPAASITDAGVIALVQRCRRLSTVDFSATRVTDEAVVVLARECPELVSLRLDRCDNLSDAAVNSLLSDARCQLVDVEVSGTHISSDASRRLMAWLVTRHWTSVWLK
jgi:hypothetical protein